MPRDLPVGNGNLLINFDSRYNLRDIYFPYVGQENQTVGDISRFGVWVDGTLAWSSSDLWERTMLYEPETLVTQVTLYSQQLSLKLICRDVVDLGRNLYLKKVELYDESGREREVRLFFHFDSHLMGNNTGDSAYFEPRYRALIHYKNKRYVWLCGQSGEEEIGLHQYAIGIKEVPGWQGTWADAEDGNLSMHPVAQGSIDSTGMLKLNLPAHAEARAYFWLAAGERFDEVSEIAELLAKNGPEMYISRTRNYWRLWANKVAEELADLSPDHIKLYKQSLLILRTQIDNRGAIIAANDADVLLFGRDTYSYMWPRDGALVANSLILAGYPDLPERFFEFCTTHLTREGYLLHKYNPDGSIGSSWHAWADAEGQLQLPIQEDETALVLYALWQYYVHTRRLEFVQRLYRPLVLAAANFMASFRDERTGLPLASYDLWEERRGVQAFSVGAIWAGLMAAANFAEFFAEPEHAQRYRAAAAGIKAAALQYLWDDKRNRFSRMVNFDKRGNLFRDSTLDSSMYGLFQFGMLEPDDPRIVSTMQAIEQRLWCKSPSGGMARYEDDYYYQVSHELDNVPGNPWFICTMWLAQWYIAGAKKLEDLRRARELLDWVCERALPSRVLAEQIHPYTNEPLSVSPLTWSHATYVTCVREYTARYLQLQNLTPAEIRPLDGAKLGLTL